MKHMGSLKVFILPPTREFVHASRINQKSSQCGIAQTLLRTYRYAILLIALFTPTSSLFAIARLVHFSAGPGNGQSGNVSSLLPISLVATISGYDNNGALVPIAGELLRFTLITPAGSTGAALSNETATSGPDGTVSTQLTLGNVPGQYQVAVSCYYAVCFDPIATDGVFSETALAQSSPLTITTASLPQKTVGQPYSVVLQASGGSPPYSWSVTGNSGVPPPRNYFPNVFPFSGNGVIGDAPANKTAPGQFAIIITVTDSSTGSASKPFVFPVSCGDPNLDKLGEEYEDYGVIDLTSTLDNPPTCYDFTQTAHSEYFAFTDLNKPGPNTDPTYNWALIRYPLSVAAFLNGATGLDAWVKLLGFPQIINSGYRSPSQNAAAGGVQASRHMWGDAVDLQNQVHPSGTPMSCNPQYPKDPVVITPCLAEYYRIVKMAIKAGKSYVEPPQLPCHYNCVHVDWRNVPGAFQQ